MMRPNLVKMLTVIVLWPLQIIFPRLLHIRFSVILKRELLLELKFFYFALMISIYLGAAYLVAGFFTSVIWLKALITVIILFFGQVRFFQVDTPKQDGVCNHYCPTKNQ